MGHISRSLTWLSRQEQHNLEFFFFPLSLLTTEYTHTHTHTMYLHAHIRQLEINVMSMFERLIDQASFIFQNTTTLTFTNNTHRQWLIVSLCK